MERILVVEDSSMIARTLQKMIVAGTKLTADTAGTMQEAAELIEKNRGQYCLAVLDLNLPDSPRGEIVDFVLSRSIPVIVVTSDFDHKTREQMLSRKICDYILKRGEDDFIYLVYRIQRLLKNRTIQILAADDSPVVRAAIADILETQLFQFYLAGDGEEALAVLRDKPDIRLVIADYAMPRMDGFDFVGRVRKTHKKDKLSIIIVSGTKGTHIIPEFLKIGANDFVRKPFDKEELVCRINTNLDMLELITENQELVQKDFLTGCFNRYYFNTVGPSLHAMALRTRTHLVVAMIDIDRFKNINDSWGHDAGDHCLQELARILKESFGRKNDIVVRFGGDEFCVMLNYENQDSVYAFFEQVRDDISQKAVPYKNSQRTITVSIGICTTLLSTLDEMIKAADEALYQAKLKGRNRTVVSA